MDRRLEELVAIDRGVFVEAGAHDGYTQSNTYYLERFRGWSGVLVEAVPALAAKAAARRPASHVAQVALVGPEHAGPTVPISFADLMSHIGEPGESTARATADQGLDPYTVEVPARTLDGVLDDAAIGAVDLMVLDLEGNELDALRGLDRERHPVSWLVVEMLDLESQRGAFDELLAATHEPHGVLSEWDAVYRLRG